MKNTWDNFSADILFSNIKKSILTNQKNIWDNFFANTFFQIFKKSYLGIEKYLGEISCSYPFKDI